VTPVEEPIVGLEDVGERTHVNAIGADAEGKHEQLDALLEAAKIVIDDHEQCVPTRARLTSPTARDAERRGHSR